MSTFDKVVNDAATNPTVKVIYFATLLVLVLLLVWVCRGRKQSEKFLGSGVPDAVFTSGATMRRLGQEFGSTNQGTYGIVHNAELTELIPGAAGGNCQQTCTPSVSMDTIYGVTGTERLVNERGEPDFWEISSELNSYRHKANAPYRAAVAASAPVVASAIPTSLSTAGVPSPVVGTEYYPLFPDIATASYMGLQDQIIHGG
jgi:hypothetical protein